MFSDNLKYLRQKSQLSQQSVAELLGIPRTTYSEYEKGNTEPNLKMLERMSQHYKISIDDLVKSDVALLDLEIEKNDDVRVLAMTMDNDGKTNIELVTTKAEAGYINGLGNPEFVADLPRLYFPLFLDGYYRAFEISGDSMLPIESGSIIIGKYIEDFKHVKNGKTHIIISHREGVVYKRLEMLSEQHGFLAISDNPQFKPYVIPFEDIQEIWQYHAHIAFSDQKSSAINDPTLTDLYTKVNELHAIINKQFAAH